MPFFYTPLFAILSCIVWVQSSLAQEARPNILLIITDDQGYGDLSAYEHHAADIATPHMDRIARQGVLVMQGYVTAPVCSPSRSGFLAGKYQQRWNPEAGWSPGVAPHAKVLPQHLQEAGYVTIKIGKNDFGQAQHRDIHSRNFPLQHGYDHFQGFIGHAHDFFLLSQSIEEKTPDPHNSSANVGPLWNDTERKSYDEGYTTNIFTDQAIRYIQEIRDRPFFMTLSYNAVHHLIHQVPQKYLDKYGVREIANYDPDTMGTYKHYYRTYNQLGEISDEEMRKYYLANLNCLDDNIGRLLDAMEEQGIMDNTLILFFSDNGGSPLTGANNQPLRGSKYRMFEGGYAYPSW